MIRIHNENAVFWGTILRTITWIVVALVNTLLWIRLKPNFFLTVLFLCFVIILIEWLNYVMLKTFYTTGYLKGSWETEKRWREAHREAIKRIKANHGGKHK